MKIELTEKQYRRLLDMVYIGNWILNSPRGADRFSDYDEVESLLFRQSFSTDMTDLAEVLCGAAVPSRAFVNGGIHEAIADYEDAVFFDILAEELARRDLEGGDTLPETDPELMARIEEYYSEFEANGIDHLIIEE